MRDARPKWYNPSMARTGTLSGKILVTAAVIGLMAVGCGKSSSDKETPKTAGPTGEAEPSAPVKPQTPAKPTPTIPMLAQITDAAGGEVVYFVATPSGIDARAGDKTLLRVVEAKLATDTDGVYAEKDGVLWYTSGPTLFALDLRIPVPQPIPVVEGLPAKSFVFVRRATRDKDGANYSMEKLAGPEGAKNLDERPTVQLEWEASPRVEPPPGKPAPSLKLVGRDWLAAEYERPMDRPKEPEWSDLGDAPSELERIAVDPNCSDEDDCFPVYSFGTSGWKLVRLRSDDEDDGCVFVDVKTKKAAPTHLSSPAWVAADEVPETWDDGAGPGTCGPYHFDFSGKHYYRLGDNELCTAGAACVKQAGPVIGFLTPGRTLSPANQW